MCSCEDRRGDREEGELASAPASRSKGGESVWRRGFIEGGYKRWWEKNERERARDCAREG